eukprot:m.1379711 g.1379711  ORF g.1379711 m.1379711 type:complete len:660 (-) comp24967_c0_seq5:3276-5255(-)
MAWRTFKAHPVFSSLLLAATIAFCDASTTRVGKNDAIRATGDSDIAERPGNKTRSAYSMFNGIVYVETLFRDKPSKVNKVNKGKKKANDLAFLLDLQLLLKPLGFDDFKTNYFENKIYHWDRHTDCAECHDKVITGMNVSVPSSIREFLLTAVSADKEHMGESLRAMVDVTFAKNGAMVAGKDSSPLFPQIRDSDLIAYLDAGTSVVVNWLHMRSLGVAVLALGLERALGLRVSINMYHTPVAEQAFGLHYDDTEVLVLHVGGQKEWKLFDPIVSLPRNGEEKLSADDMKARGLDTDKPIKRLTLRPGDLLYFPRGTPHYAWNSDAPVEAATGADGSCDPEVAERADEPTTHLTIGITVYPWQTIEAVAHLALMQATHGKLYEKHDKGTKQYDRSVKRVKKTRTALKRAVSLVADPEGHPVGVSAYMVLHAAIRAVANQNSVWRQAASLRGEVNVPAIHRAIASLCDGDSGGRPTMAETLRRMLQWDSVSDTQDGQGLRRTGNVTGLGSVLSLAQDLVDIGEAFVHDQVRKKGKPTATGTSTPDMSGHWQTLVDTAGIAKEALKTADSDPSMHLNDDEIAGAERFFGQAWAAFCSNGVNGLTEDTTKATRPKWLEAATRSIGKHWEKTNAEYHAWWRQNLLNHDVSESELRTHLAPLAG